MMEGLALTGAWVDEEKGLLLDDRSRNGNVFASVSASQRRRRSRRHGTNRNARTEIPENETVLLAGGGYGNAVLFSIARAMRENNNEVIYFAGYKNGADLFKREEIENATDKVVWATDFGDEISAGQTARRAFSRQYRSGDGRLRRRKIGRADG